MRLVLVRALGVACIATAAGATPVDTAGQAAETAPFYGRPYTFEPTRAHVFSNAELDLGVIDADRVSQLHWNDRRDATPRSPGKTVPETTWQLVRAVLAKQPCDAIVLLLAALFLAVHVGSAHLAVACRRHIETAVVLVLTCAACLVLFLARAGSSFDALALHAGTTPAIASAPPPFSPLGLEGRSLSALADPALGEPSRTATAPVPEASPALLIAFGLAALVRHRRRRA